MVQDFFHQQYHFKMDGLEEDFFFLKRFLFRGTCQISGGRCDIDVFLLRRETSCNFKLLENNITSHVFQSFVNFNFVWEISVFGINVEGVDFLGWNKKMRNHICTWNPNDPCFDWKRPCFGGLTFKNRGHLGSSYTLGCEFPHLHLPRLQASWVEEHPNVYLPSG